MAKPQIAKPRWTKRGFARIAAVAVPVAVAATVGLSSADKGTSTTSETAREKVDLTEINYDICQRNPDLLRCRRFPSDAASVNRGQTGTSSSGNSVVSEGRPVCPAVESFVSEVAREADATWAQVEWVNSVVKSKRGSSATRAEQAQDANCLASLAEPLANYDLLKRKPKETCRNNYDRENENLIANKNLLAAFKNRVRQNPECRQAASILGVDRAVASVETAPVKPSLSFPGASAPAVK